MADPIATDPPVAPQSRAEDGTALLQGIELTVDQAVHPDRVLHAPPQLGRFNDAGVLRATDIHTARVITQLVGEDDPQVMLAIALAVRAPSYGHVCADLRDIRDTVTSEDIGDADLSALPWPDDLDEWIAAVADSRAVGEGCPLVLDGSALYLTRYHRHESVATQRLSARMADVAPPALRLRGSADEAVAKLFAPHDDTPASAAQAEEQAAAARAALSQRLTVITGGPGTGKTTTIGRLVRVMASQSARADGGAPRIAVAAPTGKAAARLGEELGRWLDDDGGTAADAERVPTWTLHRLLKRQPGSRSRTIYSQDRPLPYDAVIVDEASMVALNQMALLLDATPADAHLVLVGDPDQLASVEAGSVLGDLVDGAAAGAGFHQHLKTGYRYDGDSAIARFATAVRDGDVDGALDALADGAEDPDGHVRLLRPPKPGDWPSADGAPAEVRAMVAEQAKQTRRAAMTGDVDAAMDAMLHTRVLCAHRRGPEGVASWNSAVEDWLLALPPWRRDERYAGRPVMVTSNDYDLDVFNGDVGVMVERPEGLRVALDTARGRRLIDPLRLGSLDTVHAMTIHKSQGSQFDEVVVVLPTQPSPILSRDLLYTAITRAAKGVTIVGTSQVLEYAIRRKVRRTSRLPQRLHD